ncbi:Crp/Fnr family transcriptional regulator [Actinomadura fibrosa]|uniref:Crp/Fnr family transcriptional regulator n=1 Tax=Actinomadura fibrosa TaxID=111802 RepID=A0ABW2XMX3_9ACTN|nr:Crp/Fnr family transcriptional regulator [Actinomadura fibrosa]
MTGPPRTGRSTLGPFLSLLRAEERRDLLEAGTVHGVAARSRIYAEGRRSAKVVVLLTAYVKVVRGTRDGERWIAYRGPGDILGELSLVDGLPHSATVRVVRAGRVAVLSYEAFDQVMRRYEGIRTALLRVVVHRLREADRSDGAAREPTLLRVARLLGRAEHGSGSGALDGTPFRYQHEIAEMLGVSRSSVVRALTELRRRGIVATGHGSIRVVRLESLDALLAASDEGAEAPDRPPAALPGPREAPESRRRDPR